MEICLSFLLTVSASLLAIPVIILCVEVIAAAVLPQPKCRLPLTNVPRPRVAVLVPAHNEGAGLLGTIDDIRAQLRPGDRLLVVADNCTDDTAQVAMTAGVEVTERFQAEYIGKGYALDWGIRHLSAAPPEIVIIIDADCRLEENAIERLVTVCAATKRPVQALYLMMAPDDFSVDHRVAVFAFRVKNWIRPLGLRALNLPCHLTGTGMAFPWNVVSATDLATGETVEDLKLGLDLVRARNPALFCPSARVDSQFPSSTTGAKTQRNRWEQGSIGMIASKIPSLAYEGLTNANFPLLVLALDASVPPLTLLGLLLCVMVATAGLGGLFHLSFVAFIISIVSLSVYLVLLFLCWLKYGRDIVPPRAILSLARYAAAKLPLYRKLFLRDRSSRWIRTDRTKNGPEAG